MPSSTAGEVFSVLRATFAMTQSYDLRRSDWFIVGLAISTVCATRAVEKTLLTELVVGSAFFLILMTMVIARSKRSGRNPQPIVSPSLVIEAGCVGDEQRV